MKKVLVTGVSSYVGNRFAEWVEQYPDDYDVDRISVRDDKWKDIDLSVYDSILHVAGIAHRKETKENKELYYRVNRDLTQELAIKAKESGVKHFVFISTMSVYGLEKGIIDKVTPLNPISHYGKSKQQAEYLIQTLSEDTFRVAIVRPPMIYGKDCKGNYQRLRKLALKTPVFPKIQNKRSMIYIDNLSEFLKILITFPEEGIYFPQNKDYVNTSELVKTIAMQNNKKIMFVKIFNPLIKRVNISIINKVFGNLIYSNDLSLFHENYHTDNFKNSIIKTEES